MMGSTSWCRTNRYGKKLILSTERSIDEVTTANKFCESSTYIIFVWRKCHSKVNSHHSTLHTLHFKQHTPILQINKNSSFFLCNKQYKYIESFGYTHVINKENMTIWQILISQLGIIIIIIIIHKEVCSYELTFCTYFYPSVNQNYKSLLYVW